MLFRSLLLLTADHLRLFLKETDAIDKLIDKGLTFEQYKKIDTKILSTCSGLSSKVEASLKFVTPQQILKINHEPLTLKANPEPKNSSMLYDSGSEGNVKQLPHLQERAFVEMVTENNSSVKQLRALPGMTQEKLNLLMTHQHDVRDLLLYGLTLADFASVDEARLEHVLTHFQEARWALKFVNASELLAIDKPAPTYSPNLFYHFDEPLTNMALEDNAKPPCVIV